jgi:hypothetical protein
MFEKESFGKKGIILIDVFWTSHIFFSGSELFVVIIIPVYK